MENGNEQISTALSKAQAEFKPVKFDKTANVKRYDKNEKKYVDASYSYASLSAIIEATRPALNKYEIFFTQDVMTEYSRESKDGYIVPEISVSTMLRHSSGETMLSSPIMMLAKDAGIQSVGAAITYAKRYSLSAMLGVSADEDTDAQEAQPSESPKTKKKELKEQKIIEAPVIETKGDYLLVDGVPRYNNKSKKLDDKYQEENGLIVTDEYNELIKIIRLKIAGNTPKFVNWLKSIYGVEWYNIQTDMLPGILHTLNNEPGQILNHEPKNNK